MAAIMDIIFSMILGGLLLLVVLDANDIATDNFTVYNGDMLVQEILIGTAQVIEGEFRNMGYGVDESVATILQADSSSFTFLLDADRDTDIDTVTFWIGDTTELGHTQNPRDRFLYRSMNGTLTGAVGVVTTFHLKFFTKVGELLPSPVPVSRLAAIHVVEVTMEVQNPYAVANKPTLTSSGGKDILFSSSLWQQTRLSSQNSRR